MNKFKKQLFFLGIFSTCLFAQSQYEVKHNDSKALHEFSNGDTFKRWMVGYVDTRNNVDNMKNHKTIGMAIEKESKLIDIFDTFEGGLLYSRAEYGDNSKTNVLRGFVNGLRYYPIYEKLKLYGLVGLGYEKLTKEKYDNESGGFFDYGVGLNYTVNNGILLKTDVRDLIKFDGDRNLLLTFGLSMKLGVFDSKTKPKSKPKEIKKIIVDTTTDTDKDGVADYIDNCPSTHIGIRVDKNGCGIYGDDDKDGVQNQDDMCIGTLKNTKVDKNGCKILPKIESLDVQFAKNSTKIKSIDESKFVPFIEYLRLVPNSYILLEAHTDSDGNADLNQRISEKRALSVKKKLISMGINADRIKTIGYGERRPLVPNTTSKNKAKNRRVSAEVIFK